MRASLGLDFELPLKVPLTVFPSVESKYYALQAARGRWLSHELWEHTLYCPLVFTFEVGRGFHAGRWLDDKIYLAVYWRISASTAKESVTRALGSAGRQGRGRPTPLFRALRGIPFLAWASPRRPGGRMKGNVRLAGGQFARVFRRA